MKTIIASDLHGVVDFQLIPEDAELCILAGDIAPLDSLSIRGKIAQCNWVRNVFVPRMRGHKGTQFVFIAGNHDFWGEAFPPQDEIWPANANYLCNSGCEVNGLKFYGVPNVPTINGAWAYESSPIEMSSMCGCIPNGMDVLITHTPPRIDGSNIDVSLEGGFSINGGMVHFGSPELTLAVERTQPRFLFCGHIHTGDHSCAEIGNTKCFNVSLIDERYELAYTPMELDI